MYAKNREIVDSNKELFGAKTEFTLFPRGLHQLFEKFPLNHTFSN